MKISDISKNQIDSCFSEQSINQKLLSGRTLRIKSGIDPSSPDIHFGHLIGLFVLKEFLQLGHEVVFVIGDFTAQLGNGRKRKEITLRQAQENSTKIVAFLKKFLGEENIEIRFQSEWFQSMGLEEFLSEMSGFTLNEVLSHKTFRDRLNDDNPLKTSEIVYPLIMSLDSVVLKPDIEVGSIEQKFNLQFARKIMKQKGIVPEDFILNKRLPGIDGSDKMSKSEGNFIGIFEDMDQQVEKLMKIPDDFIPVFWSLLSDKSQEEIETEIQNCNEIIKIKKKMTAEILSCIHKDESISDALREFGNKSAKTNIKLDFHLTHLKNLLVEAGLAKSIRESKRFIQQNAIKLNGFKTNDPEQILKQGDLIEFKKKFITIIKNHSSLTVLSKR